MAWRNGIPWKKGIPWNENIPRKEGIPQEEEILQKEGIPQKSEAKKEGISKEQIDLLQEELKRTGVAMEAVQERYKITSPESMNEKTYKRVMEALAKTKAA